MRVGMMGHCLSETVPSGFALSQIRIATITGTRTAASVGSAENCLFHFPGRNQYSNQSTVLEDHLSFPTDRFQI
jgi:hypothetical protein